MSSVRKPTIPFPDAVDPQLMPTLLSLKEWVEIVQGLRGTGQVKELPASASLTDVINKVNEIIRVLQ